VRLTNTTLVEGKKTSPHLVVLALSTCGFCKRAMTFLQEQGFSFEYLHLDQISPEDKAAIKEQFKSEFELNLAFPTLVIDGKEIIIGFIEVKWREKLGLI